jgi:hypothetical protein
MFLPLNGKMRLFSKISILLAGIILMLHTMMPHEHHSSYENAVHIVKPEPIHNIFELIRLAFHFDQGEGHLDQYKQSNGQQLDFKTLFTESYGIDQHLVILEDRSVSFPVDQVVIPIHYLYPHLRFRGPPLS